MNYFFHKDHGLVCVSDEQLKANPADKTGWSAKEVAARGFKPATEQQIAAAEKKPAAAEQ